MAHRTHGEGSIYQRKDGRWVGSIMLGGKRFTRYADTRKEASEELQKLQAKHATGTLVSPNKLSVRDFLVQWLDSARLTRKASTLHFYEDVIAVHLNPALGDLKLQRLAPQHLIALYRKGQTQGLSPRRIAMIHAVIRTALVDAVTWQLVPMNVAASVRPPRSDPKPRVMWNDEEIRRFATTAINTPDPYAWTLMIMLSTGIRVSEMLGLTWDVINVSEAVLTIRKALVWAGKQSVWEQPKSKAGVRKIPLPPVAVQCLNRLPQWQEDACHKVKSPWKNTDGRVVCTDTGGVPTANTLKRALDELCVAAAVPTITVHGLRHHYASVIIRAGVDVKQAQILLGHSRPSVTLDTYSHLIDPDESIAWTVQTALEPDKPRSNR